ncbi:MAG: LolA-like putative outer membrane lipoprotein chaperone [Phocaeicola sp.]
MKKITYIVLLFLIPLATMAQKDARAREILDRTCKLIEEEKGISILFEGTLKGTMKLKGDKFHLQSQGIESWYDGRTQWSYLTNSDEVNITSPTPEDLKQTHPLYLLSSYKEGYNYKYLGEKKIKGAMGYEILLTPEKKEDIISVTLIVSKAYKPLYLKISTVNQSDSEVYISSFQTAQAFADEVFSFNKKKYPDAEIIDLR